MNENEYKLEIYVTKDNVTIKNKEKVHVGEYKITKCEFEFTEDYEGLTKKAIFEAEDVIKEMPIISNECDIPEEVLQDGYLQCNLRVYGYDIEEVDGEMTVRLRYSPTYDTFPIWKGSFIPNAEQGEEITSTQFEQYSAALNEGLEAIDDKIGEVNTALENVSAAITQTNNLNLDVNKVDDTATVTLTKKDGTPKTVEITDGKDGEDGHTPVKGVDYYTEEEVQGIVNEITEKAEKDVIQANMVYNALPKVTGSGEEITLNNTAETPLKLTLKGNTYQETTTGKNYLRKARSKTENGITFTVQEDNTIIVNGTATANTSINFSTETSGQTIVNLPAGTYVLSGCPSGGSASTYRLSSNFTGSPTDYGQGVEFTLSSSVTSKAVWFTVYSGTTINNLVIKPMLRLASTTPDYEPYTGRIPAPNPDFPMPVQVVTGDNTIKVSNKNLFNTFIDYQSGYSTTINGVTFTINSDGTITANGTATAQANFVLWGNWSGTTSYIKLDNTKTYKLSAHNEITLQIRGIKNGVYTTYNSKYNNQNVITNQDGIVLAQIIVANGTTVNNAIIKPQIELGSTISEYTPYQSQEYEINLGVENFLPNPIQSQTLNGITVTRSADGVLTLNGTSTAITYFDFSTDFNTTLYAGYKFYGFPTNPQGLGIRISTSNRSSLQDIGSNGTALNDNGTGKYIALRIGSGITLSNYVLKPMLVSPTITNPDYTPYGVAPIELCKIGDYQDYIYKEGKKWYKHTEIGKTKLLSTWNWFRDNEKPNSWRFYSQSNAIPNSYNNEAMSNYFKGDTVANVNNIDSQAITTINYIQIALRINKSIAPTVDDLKTWLSNNEVYDYTILSTPTEEQITNAELIEQLNDLYYAYAYQEQTNINQSNSNLASIMNAETIRDLSNIFTNEE